MSFAPEVVQKLSAPLDPGRVKHREGSGGRSLSYLEGHDVIRAANDVFGIGNWGYHVEDLTFLGDEPVVKTYNGQTREGFRVAYRATVAVHFGAGLHYSDVGFGDAVEYVGSKLTPHELASKEAVTDALKRALKNLGDQFGLCLYDKFAPEHNGHSSAGTSGGSGGSGVGEQGLTANSPSSPAPTSSSAPTDKQLGFLRKLMGEHGATEADLGKTFAELTKHDASQFIEQFKSGTFNPASLAATGGGFVDDDIPFAPSIDGLGN